MVSGDGSHLPHVVVDIVTVVVIGVVVVVNDVIVDSFCVVDGAIVGIAVVSDGIRVANCPISPYILMVATAGRRRSGGAATPAKQR